MSRVFTIDARWDGEAAVWLAASEDVAGLVVEADNWRDMIAEVRLILPELLALEGQDVDELSLTFQRHFDDCE